ncbi:N-acetyltransferase [Enterobacillus tribolii]|uniref:Putative acetyltransferase n=1 Tax=Enterobacillus tribolii TaxID=1487935 RepID=A0A370QUK0_9GAMM|nr:N-acetyltransferase [Enterobacillus tribolii]MBW7981017.1 N-acetyltransferase [Enterobacillus tribolii]RDK92926.1 putative acetyltransferase [Enterobacillus tribolii]
MIRPATEQDTDALMALWLTSTTQAHPFIAPAYWQESAFLVRNTYLPSALTWLEEQDGRIVGFISVLEQAFIGALFVDEAFFGTGAGYRLMQQAKALYPRLWLEVYRRNHRAMAFYLRQGFSIQETEFNEETGHHTVVMMWEAEPAR